MLRPTRFIHEVIRQGRRRIATQKVESSGKMESSIHEKLTIVLKPVQLTIINESHLHRHHAAMRAQGGGNGETHFRVQVISDLFRDMSTIRRHRWIYKILSDELAQGLHALTLLTKTPEEVDRAPVGSCQ